MTGSDICAEAGYNPWGLTWLFEDFQAANPTATAAALGSPRQHHPDRDLKKHFQDNPSTFSKFNPDPKSATTFVAPKDAPVVFLRPEPAKK